MRIRKFKGQASIAQLMALFIITCYLLSCQSQQEIKPTESEMVVGIDPDFTPEPDPTDNGRVAVNETVILNKVRLWLARGENPQGTFRIKIVRVSDGYVMIRSQKTNASGLKYIFEDDPSRPGLHLIVPGKVILDLSDRTLKLRPGTKYKVEVECSTVVDIFEDGVIWCDYIDRDNVSVNGPYAPGTPTIRLIFDDGSEEIRVHNTSTDFMFETENRRSDGTTYTDQSQKKHNSIKCTNCLFYYKEGKKNVFGQEFVPSVR